MKKLPSIQVRNLEKTRLVILKLILQTFAIEKSIAFAFPICYAVFVHLLSECFWC